MSGFERLSEGQAQVIAALLAWPTVRGAAGAAGAAGVGESTLRRWMHDPDFQAAYRAARREALELALGTLQAAAGEAVKVLREALASENPAVRVRAALGLLDRATSAAELLDFAERIEALEAAHAGAGAPATSSVGARTGKGWVS